MQMCIRDSISPDFSGEALSVAGATCILFGGETPEPEKVRDMLLEEIARLRREGIDRELFRLCKNAMYGDLVRGLENIEESASGMASMFFRGCTVEDEAAALAALRPEDVEEALSLIHIFSGAGPTILAVVRTSDRAAFLREAGARLQEGELGAYHLHCFDADNAGAVVE